MKAMKKPIAIEVFQYDPNQEFEQTSAIPEWMVQALAAGVLRLDTLSNSLICRSDTHGDIIVNPSDWIMRGVEGEIYPCKDSVFQSTYNIVEQ